MTSLIAELRLYETPDGDLVEELEDSGSLFCGVGAELDGDAAKRYQAYVRGGEKPVRKSVRKSANKEAAPSEDKAEPEAEPSLEDMTVAQLSDLAGQMELDVGNRPRKDDLIDAIEEATTAQAAAAAAASEEIGE